MNEKDNKRKSSINDQKMSQRLSKIDRHDAKRNEIQNDRNK